MVERHLVDAEVAAVQAGEIEPLGPVPPAMHPSDLVLRVLSQHAGDEILEPASLLRLVARLAADALERLADGRFSGLQVKADLLLNHDGCSELAEGGNLAP